MASYAAPNVVVDGQILTTDVPPIIQNERVFVPLRAILEQFGFLVGFNVDTQNVYFSYIGDQQSLWTLNFNTNIFHSKQDGTDQLISPSPFVYEGRTMVPLRFLSEALGFQVTWDDATQTATINKSDATQLSPVQNNIPVYDSFKIQNGNYYEGYAINRVPNGYGIMTYTKGVIAEGVFVNGISPRNGYVKITFPDKGVYEGDVDINGELTGQGKLTEADGSTYSGGFKNLQKDGYGEVIYPDGSTYKGYWKDGLRDGYGEAVYTDGSMYKGYWKDGDWDGVGTIYSDGKTWNTLYSNGVDITPNVYVPPVQTYPTYPTVQSSGTIVSRIDGVFEGWDGETIFKLMNGQIWQQSSYGFTFHYAYSPEVIIYPSGGRYKMHVDGVDDDIFVERLK